MFWTLFGTFWDPTREDLDRRPVKSASTRAPAVNLVGRLADRTPLAAVPLSLVKASWSHQVGSTHTTHVFTARCSCGQSASLSLVTEIGVVPANGLLASSERAVWAAFVRLARETSCTECRTTAGRWLREEPPFARPRGVTSHVESGRLVSSDAAAAHQISRLRDTG